MGVYWALLETAALIISQLYIHVPMLPWVGNSTQRQLSMATEASLLRWNGTFREELNLMPRASPNYRRPWLPEC